MIKETNFNMNFFNRGSGHEHQNSMENRRQTHKNLTDESNKGRNYNSSSAGTSLIAVLVILAVVLIIIWIL